MRLPSILLVGVAGLSALGGASPEQPKPAPTVDRVGFPTNYAKIFEVLRVVQKPEEHKIVTIYGNAAAASVTNVSQLPYPYGAVIVMETAKILDAPKQASTAGLADPQPVVSGLHVMRRGLGFGELYGTNRAGGWEYVEYKPDGNYLTPPERSAACAECHRKAGPEKDFVYKARFATGSGR